MGNFKVGDKVVIKTLDWYDFHADGNGNILLHSDSSGEAYFNKKMSEYCGKEATIISIEKLPNNYYFYRIDVDNKRFLWMDEMFIENINNQKKSNYSDVWKFGNLFIIVNEKDKKVFPDFFITKEEAEHKLWEILK